MLPVDPGRERQREIFRGMTPAARLAVAEKLYWSARAMKEAYLRQQHPDWTEVRVRYEAQLSFLHART